MKICADEHVSPKIVSAIREIASREGWEITSVHDIDQAGERDEYWITAFAQNGGNAILSADKDFVSRTPQITAVFKTGLRVILLPKKWGQAKRPVQAAFILQWWGRIEKKIEEMNKRECYQPKWNIKETGDLKKIIINFGKAQKKKEKGKKFPDISVKRVNDTFPCFDIRDISFLKSAQQSLQTRYPVT